MSLRSMKFVLALIVSLTSVSGAAHAHCLWDHVMLTGASVSAGYDGSFYDRANVSHEAHAGWQGTQVIALPDFSQKAQSASLVLSLDFFYWDQFFCGSDAQKKNITQAMDLLFQSTVQKKVPLVMLSLVPGRPPFQRVQFNSACAPWINEQIKIRCDLTPQKCLLVDGNALFNSMGAEDPRVLTRDGIHPTTVAYAAIERFLDQTILASKLECR